MARFKRFTNLKCPIQDFSIEHFELFQFLGCIQKIRFVKYANKLFVVLFLNNTSRYQSTPNGFNLTNMFGNLQIDIQSDQYSYLFIF